MEELSVEQKAKRYDEALEKARQIHDADRVSGIELTTCEEIFPELKESEDERMRKHLIGIVELYYGNTDEQEKKDCLVWLEKQCEHKKFRDAIQVGDKVTRNEDGVLVNLSQLNRVAKPADKQGEQKTVFEMKTPEESLGIDSDTYNKIVDECIYSEQKPTWSEEDEKLVKNLISTLSNLYARNLIEKETKEKYTNLLKSIKDRVQTQPKQKWSEEDEKNLLEISCLIGNYRTGDDEYKLDSWLKSLKERVHPQPKSDWGEEDEKMLQNILECLKKGWRKLPTDILKYESWLNSLRPQNTWKPSDAQMDALEKECIAHSNYELCRLLEQLKKLKE